MDLWRNREASKGFMRAVGRSESLLDHAECGEDWSGARRWGPDPQPTHVLPTVWRAVGPAVKEKETREKLGNISPPASRFPSRPSLTGDSGPGPGSYLAVSAPQPLGNASASSPLQHPGPLGAIKSSSHSFTQTGFWTFSRNRNCRSRSKGMLLFVGL